MNEEKSENERDNNQVSKMKSIQEKSELLMQQISFAKHFLKMIAIKSNDNNELNFQHKQLIVYEGERYEKKLKYFDDSLYVPFDEFNGLKIEKVSTIEGMNIIDGIVSSMIEFLNKKVILNDNFLILCLQYCNSVILNSDVKENKILAENFIDAMIDTVSDCLHSEKESSHFSVTGTNLRNYYYFQQFLLFRFVNLNNFVFSNS